VSVFRVIDFETTGVKAEDHPAQIIEYGFQDVLTSALVLGKAERNFVRSAIPCDVEARAVHHITDEEIASGVPLEHALLALTTGTPDYFVAHNAEFEQEFFTGGQVPWICTYKCALRIWPDAPRHTNQVLRYWLGIDCDFDRAFPPHRALPDAYVTAHILVRMLKMGVATLGMLEAWSKEPPMPKHIKFGKHRGAEWAELPRDYLAWIADKSDMDADTKWLARKHLGKR